MLKIHVFLDVTLCRWINSSRDPKDQISFISNFTHWYSRMPNYSGIILVGDGCVTNISPCTSVSYGYVILYCCMYSSVIGNTTQYRDTYCSTGLKRVYKNPHCALCNGVPPLNTACWVPPRGEIVGWQPDCEGVVGQAPSLSKTFILEASKFETSKVENQQHRWQYVTQTNEAVQNLQQGWWFEKFLN